ncbi:DsbA family protein [Candidatus Microgenomates bacterium]|nr:MAG: DsbA family protein [Candidatus Microgenomates bacterium]
MQEKQLTKKERREIRQLERISEEKKQSSQKLLKTVGIWTGVVGIIILSIFGLLQLANTSSTPGTETSAKITPVGKDDIKVGSSSAKVTLVEYADFQCPGCAAFYPVVKQLLADYEGKILYVYRFFPLRQIHKNALTSAQAAYAAHLQGKFPEMEDLLFTNQTVWAEDNNASDIFLSYAQKINLDLDKYKKDYNSEETKKFIEKQENGAISLGVNSTPTIFINGEQVQNARTYEALKEIVEKELKASK